MLRLLPSADKNKPRFELHLKIYDLNNVPLVAGWSLIKWNIVHSMHAEHKGTTERCAIANHRVYYSYSKLIGSVRIPIDKTQRLSECWLQLEVMQEYSSGGMRDEKVPLGVVRVNLSEFVEESMAIDVPMARRRPGATSALTTPVALPGEEGVQEGVIRRYLLQDSKINSTLKIGVLMVQVDGDRNYAAPPLKTAPVFGGLAGIMAGEAPEQADDSKTPMMSYSKSRDLAEADLYRSMLVASWHCPPDELRADEVVEEIFRNRDATQSRLFQHHHHFSHASPLPSATHLSVAAYPSHRRDSSLSADDGYSSAGYMTGSGAAGTDTLRPGDARRLARHARHGSDASGTTATAMATNSSNSRLSVNQASVMQDRISRRPLVGTPSVHRRNISRGDEFGSMSMGMSMGMGMGMGMGIGRRSRSGSFTSLAPTDGSGDDRGRDMGLGYRPAREIREFEVRDNMVSWTMPKQQLV